MKAKEYWSKASPVALLTIVVAVSVSILTFVDSTTRGQIDTQEQQKTERLIHVVFPDMSRYDFQDEIYTIYSDSEQIGYAFIAVGNGYGGNINILVGLENDATIKGITIISQTETPGLGTRITESPFIDQFAGININDVRLSKDGGRVDAITGSTISSSAVVEAVRTTALERVKQIKELEGGG